MSILKEIHLFISSPYPLACLIGWLWNKGPKIFLYEYNAENRTYF